MTQAPRKPRVLVIEDEDLVAMLIETLILEMGFEHAATAADLEEALNAASGDQFDIAVLNLNLDGRPTYPVADVLGSRGIPFIFATGYGTPAIDARFAGVPAVQKPFRKGELEAAMTQALGGSPAG
jgi:CheY-like chemotaxis protein